MESSDKTWSTGGGNGKLTPMFLPQEPYEQYGKTKKDMTLEGPDGHWKCPGPKLSNMLLGKSRETAAERMKRLGQSKNNTQL